MNVSRLARFAGVALVVLGGAVMADPLAVSPPRALQGPYPVGCTNLAQDFSRVPQGETARDFWEGDPRSDGATRYLTELLSDPSNVVMARVETPNDALLFGPWRDQTLVFPTLVCYPTSASNARADLALPGGGVIPRMQRGGEAPILADAPSRWPMLAFSHGYGGSPLSSGYIEAIAVLASNGYVVVAPFHGDPRFALLSFDDLDSAIAAISQFERYTAMQALRPLAVSAALDAVLAHPEWRDRIDVDRIGGFGASQGGETMMLLVGAELTTSIFQTSARVTRDERIRGAVGYVPYFGQRILPAFGRGNRGVEGLTTPFLAISGTADVTAPIGLVEEALHRMSGSRRLVALTDIPHGFDPRASSDIFTWTLEWLDAFVKDDRHARARVMRMSSVTGGVQDVVRIDHILPASETADERKVIEYYNEALDHYFVTAEPAEIEMLDAGVRVPGWRRTGHEFKSWSPGSASGVPACRFFGTPGRGPNSHFFTIDANECAIVRANPDWTFESLAFQAATIVPSFCPANLVVVWRLYNNGMGGQANHRYLTSHSAIGDMIGRGWLLEGPVFCTPP
jgi:hypothetical protein